MILLLFYLALCSGAGIVVDYPASQMGLGWIQIALRSPSPVSVQHVIWCKSDEPNHAEPPPPDIAECEASNLLHLQLYPNARPYLRDPPEAEPNMLYIDASDLGGWDTQHQMDIVVMGNKGAFRQVVRFNPLQPAPTTEKPTPTEEPTPAPTTEEPTVMLTTEKSTMAPTSEISIPTQSIPLAATHPWFGSALFLGSGLVFITLVALLLRWRQTRTSSGSKLAEATRYQWNEQQQLPPGAEIEMVEMTRIQ